METKRCQRCHKLLRMDAQTCSRCGGYDFLPVSQARNKNTGSFLSSDAISAPSNLAPSFPSSQSHQPSLPSQHSPHRAGHYAGLHPEDEPYQSSFLPVQRPPLHAQPALEVEEVEDQSYSTVLDASIAPTPVAAPKRRVASFTPLPLPGQQRSAQTYGAPIIEQDAATRDLEIADAATIADPRPLALPTRAPKPRRRSNLVPVLLITSGFLFVVASGILGYLLLSSGPRPPLKAQLIAEQQTNLLRVHDTLLISGSGFEPDAAVKITRDANIAVLDAQGKSLQVRTFSTGNFFVEIPILESWNVGKHVIYATDQQNNQAHISIVVKPTPPAAPQLKLALAHLDLGEDNAGVVSHKSITLTNAGGGEVNWQGSSDQPSWLALTPNNGSFSGSAEVVITVDRSNLAPKSYTGHISFTQQGSANQDTTLTVTMGVNPASANLVLSNAAFTFNGNTTTNPAAQPITIQNTGGQGLNWTALPSTPWLTLSSSGGYLGAGAVATMTVSVTSAGLSVGTYQGTLTFSYAGVSATPVTVTLIVGPPPVAKVAIQPGGLNFRTIQGQDPPAQSFTITNSGDAPLNWGIIEDNNGKTYAPVSQSNGTLGPSKSVVITVAPSISQVSARVLNALITVIDTDAGTPVKSQQITVTITIVNQAVISLNQSQLNFNHTGAIPLSTQLITLTNTGSAPLNWSLTITNTSPIQWLTVDNSGGKGLNPGGADFINVQCDSSHLSLGNFTATLTLRDTDPKTPVAPVIITVVLVVSQ
jgi:Viral BACON domain